MALPNLIVSAVAEWNGKALTRGSTQIGKFNKTVMGLGRTLGITFSAAALLSYSKKAVAAYGEQIAEEKRLDTALRNLGFNFATAEAEGYIDSAERVTGVNRDQLQPSFIQLAQTTRSTTMAQSMLNTALDISAGTGMDLVGATKILSQAYVGNYKGLKQLNLGLTQTELASKSYLEVEKLIADQYAGQSKNAANSYEGSLNRLKIAAEQASEQIGQSLVAALSTSSGGIDKLIDKVDSASDSVSGLITNVSILAKDLGDLFGGLPGAGVLENIFRGAKNYLGTFSIGNLRRQVDIVKGRQGGFPQGVPQDLTNLRTNAEKAKMDKLALKRQKELLALQKKAELAKKNEISLTKAAAEFDTNRISIAAALKATYDKDTRLRLEALMAIEDDNGELALSKIRQLGLLQEATDAQKLAGIKTISDTTLSSLNAQLLAELKVINDSKMAEGDKELAREEAFKKYNAAITAAGALAAKEQYSERTQIQLTEIARLAALSNTNNAAITLGKLRESAELSMIDRIAKAQKAADDARLKALQDYAATLGKIGSASITGVITGNAKGGVAGATGGKSAAQLAQEAALLDFYNKKLAEEAAAAALSKVGRGITDPDIVGTVIEAITPGGSIESILEYADAATARANAMADLLDSINAEDTAILASSSLGSAMLNALSSEDIARSSLIAGLSGGAGVAGAVSGSRYAAQAAAAYNITINAGAIASQDEFAGLIQDTIQRLNRGGDPLTTAGVA